MTKQSRTCGHSWPRQFSRVELTRFQISASSGTSARSLRSPVRDCCANPLIRSEEHTSELQSLMRIPYAVFCVNPKNTNKHRQKRQRDIENKKGEKKQRTR